MHLVQLTDLIGFRYSARHQTALSFRECNELGSQGSWQGSCLMQRPYFCANQTSMAIDPTCSGPYTAKGCCGCNSVVEYLVANEVVVGSSPITRSRKNAIFCLRV